MKRKIFNICYVFVGLFFVSCGGGGDSGITKTAENPITSTNYSSYAWNINSNINNSFKTTYNINDNSHINLPINTNSTQKIKVAIIDENFQVAHPDIKDKVIATYNVMDQSSNVLTSTDSYSHGTAVAGVIASTYLGAAPKNVELILINIDLETSISESYFLEAFSKAEELGARVINCSWGGSSLSENLENKIEELKNKGIVIVFASGNGDIFGNAIDLDINGNEDESESQFVLGVGATSKDNDVTSYSNYGSNIDILAPGGDSDIGILSLDLLKSDGYNPSSTLSINGNNLVNENYSFILGTSFSAPTVSGVIALMLSENQNLTFDEIRNILITTTQQVGLENQADYSVNNFDTKRAYGKIDATKAIEGAIDAL